MNELKDYLPLYLGHKIEYFDLFENKYSIGVLNGIHSYTGYFSVFVEGISSGHDINKCKLILRPLSSMTEEELNQIFGEKFAPNFAKSRIKMISESLHGFHTFLSQYGDFDTETKMREKGFDLYNLKERGLAIYPEDLKS